MRPQLILLGAPGTGKGTQAKRIVDEFGYNHVSTGDLLRGEIAKGSELGQKVKGIIDRGDLVNDQVVLELLNANCNISESAYIFDGFPRTESQAEALDAFLSDKGEQINGMIALEVPEDTLVTRLLERGKTSGRTDDTDESKIRNRFNEYNTKTAILKDYFDAQNKYYGINGVGSIEDITKRISEVFDTL